MSTRRELGTALTLVTAVVVVAWGASLGAGFFLDDLNSLERAAQAPWTPAGLAGGFTVFDPHTAELWLAPDRQAVSFFRPLFVLSLKLDHLLFGTWAPGYHLVNLALHALNALLVWGLARAVGLEQRVSLFAAALFAGFGHHTVAVIWLSGRTELLLAALALGSVLCHLRGASTGGWGPRLASWALALGALGTKESAVVLPGLLLLAEWMAAGRRWPTRELALGALKRAAPVLALTLGYLVLRLGVVGMGAHPPEPYFHSPTDPSFPLLLAARTAYVYGAWLLQVPVLPVDPVAALVARPALLALALAVALGAWGALAWVLRGEPRVLVLVAWTALTQAPVALLMASNHYLYLGSAAVVVLLALALSPRQGRGRWVRAGVLGLGGLLTLANIALGHLTYLSLSAANERLAEQVVAADPSVLTAPTDLYLVNAPALSLHLGQRLRVVHGARDLRAHLLVPAPGRTGVGPAPELRWLDEHTLELSLSTGLLEGEVGEALVLSGASVTPGRSVADGPALITAHAGEDGQVRRLVVELGEGARVVVFQDGEDGVEVEWIVEWDHQPGEHMSPPAGL